MVRRMDRAGVRLSIFSHHAAISSPDVMNRFAVEAARANPTRFRVYCVFHPVELGQEQLDAYDRFRDVYVGR